MPLDVINARTIPADTLIVDDEDSYIKFNLDRVPAGQQANFDAVDRVEFLDGTAPLQHEGRGIYCVDATNNQQVINIPYTSFETFTVKDTKSKFNKNNLIVNVWSEDGEAIEFCAKIDKKGKGYRFFKYNLNWFYSEEGTGAVVEVEAASVSSADFLPVPLVSEMLLYAQESADQPIAAVDTPQNVTFGAAQNGPTDKVELSAGGVITFNDDLNVNIALTRNVGRTTDTDTSKVMLAMKLNGAVIPGSSSLPQLNILVKRCMLQITSH